jgi:precorrin-6B methylase 1
MAPTVGRIVWYQPKEGDPGFDGTSEPLAAIVCRVWNPLCVNLAVFDRNGHRFARTNVAQATESLPYTPQGSWRWMPYQIAQPVIANGLMERVAALESLMAPREDGRAL